MTELKFEKNILIYIPCYNCKDTVATVIRNIPKELWLDCECLVVDNCSNDGTFEVVLQEIRSDKHPFKISLVSPKKNLGYAGSQKLAYQLALKSPQVKQVIMLHGDGQYPPALVSKFMPYFNSEYGLVNGFRDKKTYPEKEQTPWLQNTVITIMNALENYVTGMNQKEWHSGFVMYSREFLSKVPFAFISDSYHIDGEMLIFASVLKVPMLSIPIYKFYSLNQKFIFWSRVKYVLGVLMLLINKYSKKKLKKIAWSTKDYEVDYEYDTFA